MNDLENVQVDPGYPDGHFIWNFIRLWAATQKQQQNVKSRK